MGARPDSAKEWPKVLVVAKNLDVGGTEKHLVRILPRLRKSGVDASLFVFTRGGQFESELIASGVSIAGPKPTGSAGLRIVGAFWALFRHMRKTRPKIAHFFLPEPYLVGSFAAILAGIKTRIMSRRSLAHYQSRHPVLARLEWAMHHRTTALIANSTSVLADLSRETADEWKFGVIYNGVDAPSARTAEQRQTARQCLNVSPEGLLIAIVANLINYKGHGDLLDALALANPKLSPDWRLFVAGRDDGAGPALHRRAASLGIAEHIIWAGERRDLDTIYAAADLFVLASHEEGFSNSLIEAMIHGLPVIATAVGGNLDAVVSGETGLLVPVRRPEALAEAIVQLASQPDVRARLGAAARERAMRLFSLDTCVERYVRLYRGAERIGSISAQDIIEPAAGLMRPAPASATLPG
jgi:glycosyltransferase involved in cell wall biosynthesis